ncbi:MAG TPA: hypothetical protein VLS89_17135 [Candidatus Nanopelagicales bacterium]|nr:hypothetical protein [Candidatus Nanopelagicales bacterium]
MTTHGPTTRRLMLDHLVQGLERFGDRYQAFGVFADDLASLGEAEPIRGLQAIDTDGRKYLWTFDEKSYELRLSPEQGVVHLLRSNSPAASAEDARFNKEAARKAIQMAKDKKGAGAGRGPLLGLLIGKMPEGAAGLPDRIFTMEFDPQAGEWRAYDGGLMRWMKQELIPRPA